MFNHIRQFRPRPLFPVSLAALVIGAAMLPGAGCDDSPLGDLAEQCGLTCPAEGIVDGNASISGIANLDAFFGAVVDVSAAANTVSASIEAEVDAIALSVGLEAGAPVADVQAAIEAKISANVSGGLTINYDPPKCEASLEVSAKAAAACDVDVEPGSLPSCEGKCTIDASAQADCSANGTLSCKGPKAQCEGSCSGNCQLDVAASCSGTCRGTCSGTCSVQDSNGNCAGACDGDCQGSCELAAGGSCSGVCEGSCEFEAASCDGGFEAKCEASADANVECTASCEGEVEPPSAKAECQASVEAKAKANLECAPPSVDISWQWSADLMGDATAQAEFRAWIGSFKGRFSAILAAGAKAEVLVDLIPNLSASAEGAVTGVAEGLAGKADLKLAIGAGCAIAELPNVATALEGSLTATTDSVTAFGAIVASVGL